MLYFLQSVVQLVLGPRAAFLFCVASVLDKYDISLPSESAYKKTSVYQTPDHYHNSLITNTLKNSQLSKSLTGKKKKKEKKKVALPFGGDLSL
jgi:hypothetical protein